MIDNTIEGLQAEINSCTDILKTDGLEEASYLEATKKMQRLMSLMTLLEMQNRLNNLKTKLI